MVLILWDYKIVTTPSVVFVEKDLTYSGHLLYKILCTKFIASFIALSLMFTYLTL